MKHQWLTDPNNYAVIVVTYDGSPFIDEALGYLKGCKYPLLLCINTKDDNAYDPAGFYLAKELGLEKFILLHDSCFVKDQTVLDTLFDKPGNVAISNGLLMCMGKFEDVPELPPKPRDKASAVYFESALPSLIPNHSVLFSDFSDSEVREHKHGKERMVIENMFLKKYKGCWGWGHVEQEMQRVL